MPQCAVAADCFLDHNEHQLHHDIPSSHDSDSQHTCTQANRVSHRTLYGRTPTRVWARERELSQGTCSGPRTKRSKAPALVGADVRISAAKDSTLTRGVVERPVPSQAARLRWFSPRGRAKRGTTRCALGCTVGSFRPALYIPNLWPRADSKAMGLWGTTMDAYISTLIPRLRARTHGLCPTTRAT